jgi:hypothetical protein
MSARRRGAHLGTELGLIFASTDDRKVRLREERFLGGGHGVTRMGVKVVVVKGGRGASGEMADPGDPCGFYAAYYRTANGADTRHMVRCDANQG